MPAVLEENVTLVNPSEKSAIVTGVCKKHVYNHFHSFDALVARHFYIYKEVHMNTIISKTAKLTTSKCRISTN